MIRKSLELLYDSGQGETTDFIPPIASISGYHDTLVLRSLLFGSTLGFQSPQKPTVCRSESTLDKEWHDLLSIGKLTFAGAWNTSKLSSVGGFKCMDLMTNPKSNP
jgi:hypothetical protein